MDTIRITLRFGDINGVSDRTARSLLKDLSKICRRVQMREAQAIMRSAKLDRRDRQSLTDRLSNELPESPAYYLDYARSGSIEIVVGLGAVGIWLLQATIGETVKSAWKESSFHNKVIDWVKNDRLKRIKKIIRDESMKHDFLGGRAYASISLEDGLVITLQRHDYVEIDRDFPITENIVLARSEEALRTVGAASPPENGEQQ